jgi:hypothetical protein
MLRLREGGAAGLLVCLLTGTLATGGIGAVDVGAAVAAQGRAENAADAVAHAVAATVAADPDRERLSIAAQAGDFCDLAEPPDEAKNPACAHAIATGREAARENRAVLLRLTLGPDLRDLRLDRGPGRALTLVLVAVRRGIPVLPARCPPQPGTGPDLCWAEAWSAAQEAG